MMRPLAYYENTTTEDGFTVHCGWYKVKGKKSIGYTNGEIYGDHMSVYWKSGNSYVKKNYPLYGCGNDFSNSLRTLSDGHISPIAFAKRIEDF